MTRSPHRSSRPTLRLWISLGAFLLGLTCIDSAWASPDGSIERVKDATTGKRSGDGVYDRFDGDLAPSLGAGLEADLKSGFLRPVVVTELSFYQSLGIYTSFSQATNSRDPMLRSLSLGVTLSPLFLWRWSKNWQTGSPFFDLTLDSIALSLGAHLSQPRGGTFAAKTGIVGAASLALPLMARANGLWLRTRVNLLSHAGGMGETLWFYISWQGFFDAGILSNY